jgi:hypothetical protein
MTTTPTQNFFTSHTQISYQHRVKSDFFLRTFFISVKCPQNDTKFTKTILFFAISHTFFAFFPNFSHFFSLFHTFSSPYNRQIPPILPENHPPQTPALAAIFLLTKTSLSLIIPQNFTHL